MTRTFFPSRPPALLVSSTAMSMPFRVEMPNVAVVPVNDPNSPTRISVEVCPCWLLPQDANPIKAAKHKNRIPDPFCIGPLYSEAFREQGLKPFRFPCGET